ncbi:hypothetical protein H6F61_06910 [Cyanobacteria bacterium FACHB-472]|nr:hypothetical protein [Cyanobacteria bacterium FACHB-472]
MFKDGCISNDWNRVTAHARNLVYTKVQPYLTTSSHYQVDALLSKLLNSFAPDTARNSQDGNNLLIDKLELHPCRFLLMAGNVYGAVAS